MRASILLSLLALAAPLLANPIAAAEAAAVANPAPNPVAHPQPDPVAQPHRRETPTPTKSPYCPPRRAAPAYQKWIFEQFLEQFLGKKDVLGAFAKYVDPGLIEHSPNSPQGADANAAKLNNIIPFVSFDLVHWGFDNGIGYDHMKVEIDPLLAISDFYRMNGTCIVEHWDVQATRPAGDTNPIGLF